MKVDLMRDDLVFKRAVNGWIIERVVDSGDGERLVTTIYEDADHIGEMNIPSNPNAESLARAIAEELSFHLQTKHRAGFTIRYSDKGREQEEEDQFMDYSLDDILEKRKEIDKSYRDTEEELKEMAEDREEKLYKTNIQTTEDGEHFVEIPQALLDELGWEVGDDMRIEETEFWDTMTEHKGFTVANLTKNPEAKVGYDENNKP